MAHHADRCGDSLSDALSRLTHDSIGFVRMLRVLGYASYGADFDTLRIIKMPNTFSAKFRIDLINFYALKYRVIWTLWLTYIAIYAFISDK